MDGLKGRGALQTERSRPARRLSAFALSIAWLFSVATCSSSVAAKEPVPQTPNAIFDPFVAAQRQDAELHSLFPLSSDRIWAVGERGLILASEDGGLHWKQQESGTTCTLRDIYFFDSLRGWAVGYGVQPFSRRLFGVVLTTVDGGKKWNYNPQHLLPPLHGIRRTETGNLLVWGGWSTQLGSSVFESLDAGRSWSPSPNVYSSYESLFPLMDGWIGFSKERPATQWALHQTLDLQPEKHWKLFHCNGENVVGIDKHSQMIAGPLADSRTWQPVASPNFLTSIQALGCNKQTTFAAGLPSSTLARSEDGGKQWQMIECPTRAPLKRFAFLDENRGWAISELGEIIATRDAGKSWWVQRNGYSQLGAMFVMDEGERIPWSTIAYCANELQRSTGLVIITKHNQEDFETSKERRRVSAAASSIGVNYVKFLSNSETAHSDSSIAQAKALPANNTEIAALLQQYVPEVIVVGNKSSNGSLLKDRVLRTVLDLSQQRKGEGKNFAAAAAQRKIHKVYAVSHPRARSLELTGSQVLKRSGKLLGDVTQRATSRYEQRVELDHPESLLLIYAENPGEGTNTDIGAGYISAPESIRPIELAHQGNLQVVLGSAARRKSLQRLLDSSGRESKDSSWDDYFKQVVDSLTRDELDISLIWLADRLREQGKWLHWQMVAETLIRRQPDGGAAEVMWQQLLVVATSSELNYWREKEVQALQQSPQPTRVVTAAAQGNDSPPTSPFSSTPTSAADIQSVDHAPLNPDQAQKNGTESSAAPHIPNQALMQWLSDQLPVRHPVLVGEPEILLQFSSWFRRHSLQTPLIAEVQNGLRLLTQQNFTGALSQVAQIETSVWMSAGLGSQATVSPNMTPAAPNFGRHLLTATQSLSRPLLDGLPDDLCWQNAQSISLVHHAETDFQPTTEVRIAFDDSWLFVYMRCERDTLTKRSQPAVRREYDSDLAAEDRVCLTLDIDRDRMTTFQFEVDQRGLTRDACWELTQWNPRWFVAQHHTDSHWMSEFAIPISELCRNERIAGSQWCVGVERKSGDRSLGTWPQVKQRDFNPIDFGILQFMTAPVDLPPTSR